LNPSRILANEIDILINEISWDDNVGLIPQKHLSKKHKE